MQAHSIDQPSAPLVHRPMSLLLQALKQIESKAPTETNIPPPSVLIASDSDIALTPPRCDTYELIGRFQESQTTSEIAVAGPANVVIAPPPVVPDETTPASISSDEKERLRFAHEVARLLPDEERAVIALASLEAADLGPVVHQLGLGLAAWGGCNVLAIADPPASTLRKSAGWLRFSDVLKGLGAWQEAISPAAEGRLSTMERGDIDGMKLATGRSLLRLWQELCDRFAYVVVDAGSQYADAAFPLLASCDATFVTVRLNRTNRRAAERLLARIRLIGGRPCGCLVINS